ncbi:hypothetical protein HGRIS_002350 [Hohenbuehelia grisea]|uniref:Protein kinase domain-containing protein n=1 Tax=Hohenbuehelia grisea TaxID=104357 RepID=A0ABR3JLF3_9AGAR
MKARRAATNEDFVRRPKTSAREPPEYSAKDFDVTETMNCLKMIVSSQAEMKKAMKLKDEEAQSFIDLLYSVTTREDPAAKLHMQCFHALRKLCGRCGTLPSDCSISDGLEKDSDDALLSGGFADVWKGKYKGEPVALKVLRIYGRDNLQKVKMSFCREAIVWQRLSHPNILPFLGANTTLFPLCMVCEWMTNGNIVNYLRFNPEANRLELLVDVANGLRYLHSIGLLHGDLKGVTYSPSWLNKGSSIYPLFQANILINNQYHACLADFGLTAVTYDPNTVNAITTSSKVLGSIRWMAPEIFHPEHSGLTSSRGTPESDTYAFAMVMYEVFTGKVPFCEFAHDATVVFKVTLGIRPERPASAARLGMTDDVWSLMEVSWHPERQRRPRILQILETLENALQTFVPPVTAEPTTAPTSTWRSPTDPGVDEDDSSDDDCYPFGQDFTAPETALSIFPSAAPAITPDHHRLREAVELSESLSKLTLPDELTASSRREPETVKNQEEEEEEFCWD